MTTKAGCGCEDAKDPYAESMHTVWHDPTSYDHVAHGPSYLPTKLASDQKRQVRASVKQAATYDTLHQHHEQRTQEMHPLSVLLAALRAAAIVHQAHHWQTRGGHYYADHLLYMRLYEESQDFIDQVAERAVGSGSESLVDPLAQLQLITATVAHAYQAASVQRWGQEQLSPEQMAKASLEIEHGVLICLQLVIAKLESTNSLSPGTSNLLEGLGDLHEQFTYLLGQRTKTASAEQYSYDHRG